MWRDGWKKQMLKKNIKNFFGEIFFSFSVEFPHLNWVIFPELNIFQW